MIFDLFDQSATNLFNCFTKFRVNLNLIVYLLLFDGFICFSLIHHFNKSLLLKICSPIRKFFFCSDCLTNLLTAVFQILISLIFFAIIIDITIFFSYWIKSFFIIISCFLITHLSKTLFLFLTGDSRHNLIRLIQCIFFLLTFRSKSCASKVACTTIHFIFFGSINLFVTFLCCFLGSYFIQIYL